jgi:hypothetical protein
MRQTIEGIEVIGMERGFGMKVLRLVMSYAVLAWSLLSCSGGSGNTEPPPQTGGPQFVINSPRDGVSTAGTLFFSAQPFNPSEIASVNFKVGDTDLGTDTTPEDGFRVFFIARDHSAGPLNLTATVTGKNGRVSTETITVINVPNPPSSTTVGPDGAALATETGSTVVIPPGVAQGANVSVAERSQEQVEAETGIDYEALGVTFLGSQSIDSSAPLDGPIGLASAGFGPRVQPGQAVVQFLITPDADGDGIDELTVINSASVAPNGDVISDPVLQIQLGSTKVTNSLGTQSIRTLQSGFSGPPGSIIDIETSGFNIYSPLGAIAVFRSAIDGSEMAVPLSPYFDPESSSGQRALTLVPPLPSGAATLTLHNRSTGSSTGPINLFVETSSALERPALEIINQALTSIIQRMNHLASDLETLIDPSISMTISNQTDRIRAFHSILKQIGANPTPEDEQLLTTFAVILENSRVVDRLLKASSSPQEVIVLCKYDNYFRDSANALIALGAASAAIAALPGPHTPAAAGAAFGFFLVGGIIHGGVAIHGATSDSLSSQQTCPVPRPPSPSAGGSGSGGTRPLTGMGSASTPGGTFVGSAITISTGTPGLSLSRQTDSLHTASLFSQEPGRVLVKTFVGGSRLAFSSVTDAGGYFFVPLVPERQPFIAIAIDTVTGEQRSFQGVGPAPGQTVFTVFDFLSEGEGITVGVELDSTIDATLEGGALFTFEGNAGQHVNVATLGHTLTGGVDIAVYGPDDSRIAFTVLRKTGFNETGVFTLPASGINTIEVDGDDATGEFTLSLALIEEPTPLTLAAPSTTVEGSLSPPGDRGFYSFNSTEGNIHNFVLSHPEGSRLNASLYIYRPGPQSFFERPLLRHTLATHSGSRSVSTGPVTLPETGEYILEVVPRRDTYPDGGVAGVTGRYSVTIETP